MNTHQRHTIHIVYKLINVYGNHTPFTLQRTRIQSTQFALYIFDTPVTLRQSQGHQTYNDNVDSKQGIIMHGHQTDDDNVDSKQGIIMQV